MSGVYWAELGCIASGQVSGAHAQNVMGKGVPAAAIIVPPRDFEVPKEKYCDV